MTLFSLCLEYVASNIQLVESLIGFPDTVGKLIFQESAVRGQFMNIKSSDTAKSNLKIFFDAYSNCGILTSLCLRQCHLFTNDALIECPWLLHNLSRLDLSFCGLGDDHEFLSQIVSILSLEVLSLQANCLSDAGIRRLTTPLRFQGKNHSLRYINLSSNNITPKSLRFLKSFDKICIIIASDTSINKQIVYDGEFGSKLSAHSSCPCCDNICVVTTDGWAAEVIERWKQEYHATCSNTSSSPVASSSSLTMGTANFYRKRRPLPDVPSSKSYKKDKTHKKLVLVTEHFRCSLDYCSSSNSTVHPSHDNDQHSTRLLALTSHSLKNKTEPPLRNNECMTQSGKYSNIRSVPYSLSLAESGDKHSKRTVITGARPCKGNGLQDGKEIKEMERSAVDESLSVNIFHKQIRKRTSTLCPDNDFDNILEFYAETYTSDKSKEDRKTSGTKKKIRLEELQDWT